MDAVDSVDGNAVTVVLQATDRDNLDRFWRRSLLVLEVLLQTGSCIFREFEN